MNITTVRGLLAALQHIEYTGATSTLRRAVKGYSTDSRSLKKGEAFVALKGEQFDGHNYLKEAAGKGASVAVVSAAWFRRNSGNAHPLPLLVVRDTLNAYGNIAHIYRSGFTIPVIAIAGSNGKTTTKDRVANVLATKYNVLRTEGNLNNLIGVPAMLLKMTKKHEVAVIEIGTNTPGEIERLCNILNPTHGVITNIGREHLELLRTISGVADEEGALFRYLAANGGTALVNLDDTYIARMARNLPKQITYGKTKKADYQGKIGKLSEHGAPALEIISNAKASQKPLKLQLQTPGKHTAYNALAAATVGFALKVPATKIKVALEEFTPHIGKSGYARMAAMQAANGATVLNDTYNANPESVMAALETLAEIKKARKGRRIAVLADMKELGGSSEAEHKAIGRSVAASNKIDIAIFYGAEMRKAYDAIAQPDKPATVVSFFFRKKERLNKVLKEIMEPEDIILVKGSRGMKMEEVVQALLVKENEIAGGNGR